VKIAPRRYFFTLQHNCNVDLHDRAKLAGVAGTGQRRPVPESRKYRDQCLGVEHNAFAVNSASANTNNAFTGVMVSAGGRLLFPVPMTIGVSGTTYIVAQSTNSGGTLQATLGLGGIMI
jgi:hypothetical protein